MSVELNRWSEEYRRKAAKVREDMERVSCGMNTMSRREESLLTEEGFGKLQFTKERGQRIRMALSKQLTSIPEWPISGNPLLLLLTPTGGTP